MAAGYTLIPLAPVPSVVPMPTTCELCRRRFPDELLSDPQVIQRHHLVPEHRKESPTVTLCRPCHEQVHATFTNEELQAEYDTLAALQNADALQGYLSWIRKTAKLDVQVRTSNRVRERRG
ncbi:HNH endonuclease [Halomarina salina]|uniref:HNH endonuclease n=1 Tax=Halomarina salina TaxID=1872699 RepID=A0ABD5RJ68_9EURY|nr:HNH endonuclease [Halomarina salina]